MKQSSESILVQLVCLYTDSFLFSPIASIAFGDIEKGA